MILPSDDLDDVTARIGSDAGAALRRQRILITGGSGFVGRWMIETFCRMNARWNLGATIGVLTRRPESLRENVPQVAADPGVTLLEGDLPALARGRTRPSWTGCDAVVHGATETSEALARDHPRALLATVEGVYDALEFAARAGARRFLYLSSGAIYGTQPPDVGWIDEEFRGAPDTLEPASAYAESKRIGELLCAAFARHSGPEVIIARGFAFIGPGLPLNRQFAAGNFLQDALDGRAVEVRGDGTTVRSFLYAGDLAWWLWTMLLRGAAGRAYNVGSEEPVTIAELAREAAGLPDDPVSVRIARTPDPKSPAERYVPSTRRARAELGLEETVGWRAALRKTYAWHRRSAVPRVDARTAP